MDSFPVLKKYAAELGYTLDPLALERLSRLRDLLLDWNRRVNLTRVTDPDAVETRLFLDALGMLTMIRRQDPAAPSNRGIKLVDIGAGAGFPGLPLKIVDPGIQLVLVEATAKKVGFINEVIRDLDLKETRAIHGRAETLAHNDQYREKFDVVTARAVARLPALLEICMPFCRPGGRGIFPKGRGIDDEIAESATAARLVRCKILGAESGPIPELSGTNYVIAEKLANTPDRFPRRAGIPAKDPL